MFLRRTHLLLLIALSLCIASLTFFVSSAPVSASARVDPIIVTSQTDTVNFPNSIDFKMTATDSISAITQATLYITFTENEQLPQESHLVTITPGQRVRAHWREDTSGGSFHTPGTLVNYYWQLQDSAQHTHTDRPQQFATVDTRFAWQHLSQGMLQVNWYNRDQGFGQVLFNRASSSLVHISQVLGSGPQHPISLWIYASNEDFHGALAPGTYEWVGGEAFPPLNEAFISVLSTDDATLIRDMPHEMTHLVFHQLISQGIFPPTWFDEGLAVYNQFYHEPEMKARLQDALNSHSLLPLSEISFGFPRDALQAYLAYAQSWNLVAYMYNTFGQTRMSQFIRKMNDSATDFNQDLQQTIGEDQRHLENQWHLSLHQPPVLSPSEMLTPTAQAIPQKQTQLPSTTDSNAPVVLMLGVMLVLASLGAIMGIVVISRRRRQEAWTVNAAGQIIATALPDAPNWQAGNWAPYGRSGSYTPPVPPPMPPAQNGQFSYYQPEQAFGAPTANNPPVPPASQFPPAWQGRYPEISREAPEQGPAEFPPGREYPSQQFERQAPQD